MTISALLRQRIRERAHFLCEYCHFSEAASASLFTLDHLMPKSLGGTDDEVNLALASHRCNGRRYNFTEWHDSVTQERVQLFNPREHLWFEHFVWDSSGQKILGITSIGRATIERLDMNDECHDDGSIQRARRFWIKGGWHPPKNDPQKTED